MIFLLTCAAAALLCLCLTPFLRGGTKPLDLPCHFIVQYAIAAACFMALCFWLHAALPLYVFSCTFGLCMMQLMPFLPAPRPPAPAQARPLKVLQVNVLKTNLNTELLYQLVQEEQPDVIVGAEVTQRFADMFAMLAAAYPQGAMHPLPGSYGLAVLSKYPLKDISRESLFTPRVPAYLFTADAQGVDISFCAIHPPTPQADIAARDGEFAAIAERFQNSAPNLVVLGDFNATPWCPALKKMVRALQLKNTRHGRGLYGSWHAVFPLSVLRLPIDLVFYRGNIHVQDFKTGPYVGSDHLPTITTFLVTD